MEKEIELLESIRDGAVDAKCDISTILRKCKVLAIDLNNKPLEDWVLFESNGYPDNATIPDYRIFTLQLKGHFAGYAGSAINYAPIPLSCLPNKSRDSYENYKMRQSVAGIEMLLANNKKGMISVSTGDLAMVLGGSVYQNYNCIQAWAEISPNKLTEILNAVRNRILDFSLAIWKETSSTSVSSKKSIKTIQDKKITQIFNTTVIHGSANIVGSAIDSEIEFNVSINDLSALKKVLLDNGISEEDFQSLIKSIDSEKTLTTNKGFGPKVSAWISKMLGKAAQGTWEIGLGAAGELLAKALSNYYGM